MGKVPTSPATAGLRRRKAGRPSKSPVPHSSPPKPPSSNSSSRRSTRLNPNHFSSSPQPEFDDDAADDDDDERKEKKVKLVVRLPQSDENRKAGGRHQQGRHSRDFDSDSASGSGSGSDSEFEDREGRAKKRKFNGGDRGSDDGGLAQDKHTQKATDTPLNGSQLGSGPTTPLPEKKFLVFILDRLQKKDTYGVFSEPVDPNELPDYFDIIERPMDFGTVRKKLNSRAYKNLEELEADVFLICSNAMQYNSSDTIYYRQARSIQELAKRDFENLKHEGDDGVPQPKIVRRGRPPNSKNQKKPLEASVVDTPERVRPEVSSGATLANEEDKATTGSNGYNLRKGPALLRSRFADPLASSQRSRNGENYSDWSGDWNNEFPASVLRADMKHGKKHLNVDENKRDTYKQSLGNNSSLGNMRRLAPVGPLDPLGYARSLARFAANLGPVAWKIASRKIEAVLPPGVEYGPGWVGENSSQPPSSSTEKQASSNHTGHDSSLITSMPATSDPTSATANPPSGAAVMPAENLTGQGDDLRSFKPYQQNPVHQPYRNGFNGMFASAAAATETKNRNAAESGIWNLGKSLQQQRNGAVSVPPDLNVRVPAGSPSSSLQIGSPRQPDLALQL